MAHYGDHDHYYKLHVPHADKWIPKKQRIGEAPSRAFIQPSAQAPTSGAPWWSAFPVSNPVDRPVKWTDNGTTQWVTPQLPTQGPTWNNANWTDGWNRKVTPLFSGYQSDDDVAAHMGGVPTTPTVPPTPSANLQLTLQDIGGGQSNTQTVDSQPSLALARQNKTDLGEIPINTPYVYTLTLPSDAFYVYMVDSQDQVDTDIGSFSVLPVTGTNTAEWAVTGNTEGETLTMSLEYSIVDNDTGDIEFRYFELCVTTETTPVPGDNRLVDDVCINDTLDKAGETTSITTLSAGPTPGDPWPFFPLGPGDIDQQQNRSIFYYRPTTGEIVGIRGNNIQALQAFVPVFKDDTSTSYDVTVNGTRFELSDGTGQSGSPQNTTWGGLWRRRKWKLQRVH